ncbi:MAG TPA: nuclear transport factor 2 family protein [Pedobacter sp.]|jgi:hypothetical protein
MKTLQILTASLIMFFSLNSFAADDLKSERLKMNYTIQTYIDATSYGKVKDIASILDYDVKYTITRGMEIKNFGKTEILTQLSHTKNVEQNCVTEYTVLEQTSNQSIVKVSMKYEGFTKVDLVSMSNTSKGWKITNISSSYL